MSGKSLRDQLLQLGLASPKPQRKQARRGPKAAPGPKTEDDISLARAYSLRQKEEQRAKELTAQKKRQDAQRRKQLNDAVAALVKPAALNQRDAPEDRYFEFQGKIRKIFVTQQQQSQLTAGQLGIVNLRGGFFLVSPEVVAQVERLKPEAVALAPVEKTQG